MAEATKVDAEEFQRRVKQAFQASEDEAPESGWGAVSWYAEETGIHFSTASRKMNGDLPITERDVRSLEMLESAVGVDR